MGRKHFFCLLALTFLLVFPLTARADSLVQNMTGATSPLPAGSCLYVSQDNSGTFADRSLCSGWSTAIGGLAAANNLSDLTNAAAALVNLAGSNPYPTLIANAGTTGTTVNHLAKLTGAPATAVITATSDTYGAVGIVTGGAGTTGNAQIAVEGQASCTFENASTAGDYVTIGATTAGDCHDAGATRPTGTELIGRVLASVSAGSTATVALDRGLSTGIAAGNGLTLTGTALNATLGLTAPVSVANGGTGLTSLTANAVYKGNGTSALAASALADNGTLVSTTEPIDTTSQAITKEIANNGTTATVANALAILTGAPSTATVALTTTTDGLEGIVVSGAGTTGNAVIAYGGEALCKFDGATTAGDFVGISATTGGDCHDAGSSRPLGSQNIGRVMSTNPTAGTYLVAIGAGSVTNTSGGGSGTVNSGGTGQLAYYPSSGTAVSGATNASLSGGALALGVANSALGSVQMFGGTSGSVTIVPQSTAGTVTLTLPSTAGTQGQPLLAGTPMTFGTLGVAGGGTGLTTLTANAPLFGNGASPIALGTRSGTTTEVATINGSLTAGDCLKSDSSGNVIDAGATCGSGSGNTTFTIAPGFTNTPGTDNTGAQTITQGSTLYPQFWVGTYTLAHSVANADGVQQYTCSGGASCTFTMPAASGTGDGLSGNGWTFADQSGFGYTIAAQSGDSFTGWPGVSGASVTIPPYGLAQVQYSALHTWNVEILAVGTSGHVLPYLDGANTWTGAQQFDEVLGAVSSAAGTTLAAPTAPAVSGSGSCSFSSTIYEAEIAYTNTVGITTVSPATASSSITNCLTVTSPAAETGATGYSVYVCSGSGCATEQLQNTGGAIAIGTNWVEPTGGLVSGGNVPGSNSALNVTLSVANCGETLVTTASSPIQATLPATLPVGCHIAVVQGGTGQVTNSPAPGATLVSAHSYSKTYGQNAGIGLSVLTNSGGSSAAWTLFGDGA